MQRAHSTAVNRDAGSEAENNIRTENQFKNGANWFFWIAGLSVLNTVIIMVGGELSFIVGLGITQIFDALAYSFKHNSGVNLDFVFITLSLLVAGIFVLFGYLARNKNSGIYITGMILYFLDGLIFLLIGDWLSLGFHVFVIFSLFSGVKALKSLKEKERGANLPPPIG